METVGADSLSAIPYHYDGSTALLVVDVQNDFADSVGGLYVKGGEEVPALANAEIAAAIDACAPVLYTQDWHPAVTPHFEKDGGIWPVHCVAGTWGAEHHPQLRVAGPTVRKGSNGEDGYSGFTMKDPRTGKRSGTGLEDRLRAAGVSKVVIVGLATDYCVRETALDAVGKDFTTIVLLDGIRAVDVAPGDGERAIAAMADAGVQLRHSQ